MFLTYAQKVIQKQTSLWNSRFVFDCAPAKCQTQKKGKRTQSCYYYACDVCVSAQRSGVGAQGSPERSHCVKCLLWSMWTVCGDWLGSEILLFCVCSEDKDGQSCNQSGFKCNTEIKNASCEYGSWKFLLWFGLWVLVNVHIQRHVGVSGWTQVQKTPSHAEKSRT